MKGIRRHGLGWQASVFVTGMPRAYEPFAIDKPLEEMVAWQERTRAQLRSERGEQNETGRIPAGTFAADARDYLNSVRALRDYRGRCYDIQLWADLFGTRHIRSIKSREIRAQRDKWLTIGPKSVYNKHTRAWEQLPIPLGASTVNHRLRALENLYTVLFPQQYNPVRDVPEAEEPEPQDRSLPYDVIDAILATMPDRSIGAKGKRRGGKSIAKAVCRFMAYSGLTFSQIMALTRHDIDVEIPAVRVARRQKGKGAAGGWKPLSPDAIPAILEFIAVVRFKKFSRSSARMAWQRACRAFLGPTAPRIRIYDLRHSYATYVLETTNDLRVTQGLLSHADGRTTQRYAKRAIPGWLAGAVNKVRFSTVAQSAGTIADGGMRKSRENRVLNWRDRDEPLQQNRR